MFKPNYHNCKNLILLEELSREEGKNFTSFSKAKKLFELFDNPQNKIPTIHIAGTNGKGSVSAIVSAISIASGLITAQHLSPHLTTVNERCLINGVPIALAKFDHIVGRIFEKLHECHFHAGYYVIALLAGLISAVQEEVELNVLEVGLGGELDASNLIQRSHIAVLTSVGLDHTSILGSTHYEIAKTKAGIYRKDNPFIVGKISNEALNGVLERINPKDLQLNGRDFQITNNFYSSNLSEFEITNFNLKGEYQIENLALAIRTAELYGFKENVILEGIAKVRWPGRLEEFYFANKKIYLDVAHNPDGIDSLLTFLKNEDCKIDFLVSILERKDWQTMMDKIKEFKPNNLYVFKCSHSGAVNPELLGGIVVKDFNEFIKLSSANVLVVTGSVYSVSDVRGLLNPESFSTFKN